MRRRTEVEFGASKEDPDFGRDLIEALEEVRAHVRGDITLPAAEPMSSMHVKAIRRRVAKGPKDFQRRFGVPARTLEGWEQGRGMDQTARVLLTVIEREPGGGTGAEGGRIGARRGGSSARFRRMNSARTKV